MAKFSLVESTKTGVCEVIKANHTLRDRIFPAVEDTTRGQTIAANLKKRAKISRAKALRRDPNNPIDESKATEGRKLTEKVGLIHPETNYIYIVLIINSNIIKLYFFLSIFPEIFNRLLLVDHFSSISIITLLCPITEKSSGAEMF